MERQRKIEEHEQEGLEKAWNQKEEIYEKYGFWLNGDYDLLTLAAIRRGKNSYGSSMYKTLEENDLIDKVNIVHCDLRKLKGVLPNEYYDLVSINPPYKKLGTGIVNEGEDYKNARHEFTCTLEDASKAASLILKFGGRFCICQRPERLADVMESMRKFSIEPKTLRIVQQRKNKAPKLFLLEGRRGGNRGFLNVLPTLFIEDENGNRKAVLNKKETAIAVSKQELIKQAFQDWIWKDPDRRHKLCELYNEKFNSTRPREYDGSHITFNGMNPEINLRTHQKNAVAHILYGGNTYSYVKSVQCK